jgi:hypothetical protein
MSEPIPGAAEAPDVIAAAALAELVAMLHTDPLAAVLVNGSRFDQPWYAVNAGELAVHYYSAKNAAEKLAAVTALFGGTVEISKTVSGGSETHRLKTAWRGVPLEVSVEILVEDEVAVLRKRLAELESAEVYRQAQLAEQQHQVEDPAVPALAVSL